MLRPVNFSTKTKHIITKKNNQNKTFKSGKITKNSMQKQTFEETTQKPTAANLSFTPQKKGQGFPRQLDKVEDINGFPGFYLISRENGKLIMQRNQLQDAALRIGEVSQSVITRSLLSLQSQNSTQALKYNAKDIFTRISLLTLNQWLEK